ncbi:MAG: tetratricopeptide repeat protein [Candidatus Zixiibacteriota bacterium]
MAKLSLYGLVLLMGLMLISGCSSKAVKHEVVEVKVDNPPLKTTVLKDKPEDERINSRAFSFYEDGLIYQQIGNYRKAAANFEQALQFYPASYQIRHALAESYFNLRLYDKALEALESIEPEDADVYLLRGACYVSLSREEEAKTTYLNLIELDDQNSIAYSHLAGYYRQSDNLDSLIWAYENLSRIRPDNERVLRELGRLQAQNGDFTSAKESFARSIAITGDPTNIMSFLGLAELYQIGGHDDSALTAYKTALEVEPYNLIANRELTALYVRMDSLAEAAEHARRVAEVTPLDRDAIRRLAVVYFGLDSLRLADSILTSLIDGGERHTANYYYLGRIAVLSGDYQKAVEQFTVLTQMADTLFESWLDLGFAYKKMGNAEKEILTYQTGLNHVRGEEGELKLMFALGAAYEQSGQFDKAVPVFEEIIAASPLHAQALNYLGYMLADRGERLEYAKDLIEKAVNLAPENGAYLDSYGWVFYRLKKYDQALVQLKKAAELESDPIIYDHLGDAYEATGDVENARVWWQKALDLQPENEQIKQKLSQ